LHLLNVLDGDLDLIRERPLGICRLEKIREEPMLSLHQCPLHAILSVLIEEIRGLGGIQVESILKEFRIRLRGEGLHWASLIVKAMMTLLHPLDAPELEESRKFEPHDMEVTAAW